MKTLAVKDWVYCPANASGERREVNKEETVAALEKQQKMIREFQTFLCCGS